MSSSDLPRRRKGGAIPAGLILIMLGGIFFLQQMGLLSLHNWWAFFILIPVFGSLGSAWALYQRSERVTPAVIATAMGGMFPLLVALIFLLDLDWGVWWPAFIILGGIGMMLGGFGLMDHRPQTEWVSRLFRPWGLSIGLGALTLGTGFLTYNLGTFDPFAILPRWWAIPILIAATGGVLAALDSLGKPSLTPFDVVGSLALSAIVAAVGAMLFLDWNMNLLMPLVLIGVGLVVLAMSLLRRRASESNPPPAEPLQ